jgi:Zn-dependent membrane protease YugP
MAAELLRSTFHRFAKVGVQSGYSGAQAAQAVLQSAGERGVRIGAANRSGDAGKGWDMDVRAQRARNAAKWRAVRRRVGVAARWHRGALASRRDGIAARWRSGAMA